MAGHDKFTHENSGRVMTEDEAKKVLDRDSSQVQDMYTVESLHAAVSILVAKTSSDGDIKSILTVDGCVACAMVVTARAITGMDDEALNIFHRIYTEHLALRAAAFIARRIAEGVEQVQAEQEAQKAPDSITEQQKQLLNMQIPGGPKWQN